MTETAVVTDTHVAVIDWAAFNQWLLTINRRRAKHKQPPLTPALIAKEYHTALHDPRFPGFLIRDDDETVFLSCYAAACKVYGPGPADWMMKTRQSRQT